MTRTRTNRTAVRSCVCFLTPDGFWTVEDVFYVFGLVILTGGFAAAALCLIAPGAFRRILLPCPIHLFFGLYCPGCGGTRALRFLLHGDIKSSFYYHLAVPYMALMGCWFMLSQTLWRCSQLRRAHGRKKFRIRPMQYRNAYLYILIALYAINFLWKNIALLVFHVRVIP